MQGSLLELKAGGITSQTAHQLIALDCTSCLHEGSKFACPDVSRLLMKPLEGAKESGNGQLTNECVICEGGCGGSVAVLSGLSAK